MIKKVIFGFALLFATVSIPATSLYATANNSKDSQNETYKVTLCHATDSSTHPYVKITVSVDAAGTFKNNGNGDHAHHTGPVATSLSVAEALKSQHMQWGDIIPAGAHNTSLNWTAAGQVIFDSGCTYVKSSVKPEFINKTASSEDTTPTGVQGVNQPMVEELAHTGANPLAATLIASGIAYILAGLGVGIKALYSRLT